MVDRIDPVHGRMLLVVLLDQPQQELLGLGVTQMVATAAMIDADRVKAMLAPLAEDDLLDVNYESTGDLNRIGLTTRGMREARHYLVEMYGVARGVRDQSRTWLWANGTDQGLVPPQLLVAWELGREEQQRRIAELERETSRLRALATPEGQALVAQMAAQTKGVVAQFERDLDRISSPAEPDMGEVVALPTADPDDEAPAAATG